MLFGIGITFGRPYLDEDIGIGIRKSRVFTNISSRFKVGFIGKIRAFTCAGLDDYFKPELDEFLRHFRRHRDTFFACMNLFQYPNFHFRSRLTEFIYIMSTATLMPNYSFLNRRVFGYHLVDSRHDCPIKNTQSSPGSSI